VSDSDVEAFWQDAKVRAGLNAAPGYLGVNSVEALAPPAWCLGGTDQQADDLAALVASGVKTGTAGALWDYEAAGEELPRVGALGIVCDSRGRPVALVQTTTVRVVAFNQVDAEHAASEGEGDLSLEYWRRVHQAFFTEFAEHDRGFAPHMPVVLERFDVLYVADRPA